MKDILLKEIMVKAVVSARQEERLSQVEAKFRKHGIRHIPVVNERDHVVGIFTLRDLIKCAPPGRSEEGEVYDPDRLDQFILKHVMTKDPLTLGPDDTLSHAINIMARDKYGCIPIADKQGKLVGIVSQIDILRYVAKRLEIG